MLTSNRYSRREPGRGAPGLWALLPLLFIFSLPVAHAQPPDTSQPVGISTLFPGLVLWDQCGWEGQRPCTNADPIYNAANFDTAFFQASASCDRGLFPINNVCTDLSVRHNPIVPGNAPSWLLSQQSDQYGRISADLPLNLVPVMGTHNSYSNPIDGGSEILNLDQQFSITDQLNLGARFIRLDPIDTVHGKSVVGCHISEVSAATAQYIAAAGLLFNKNFPTTASAICATQIVNFIPAQSLDGAFSFERPIYLAVEEIQHWLANNPGEVVLIIVNNYYTFGQNGYVPPADLGGIFQHVLGNKMLTPQEYQAYHSPTAWPTLRQMRAMGKQAMVFFSNVNGSGVNTNASGVWSTMAQDPSHAHWNSTSAPGYGSCVDYGGYPVGPGRDASTSEWNGEDRSLSNALNTDSTENGLMDWQNAAIATQCGYGTISFDFLYSLGNAVNNTYVPYPGSVNYTTGGNFFPEDSATDERPQWLIWSWLRKTGVAPSGGGAAALVLQTLTGNDFGAYIKLSLSPVTQNVMTHRWQQMSTSTAMPYACAGPANSGSVPFPDPGNMWVYTWNITTASGIWANGEDACQTEFGSAFHFWRPMSAPENRGLISHMTQLGISQLWLNYNPGATVAFPSQTTLSHSFGGSNNGADVVVNGGFGGTLTASFTPDASTPDFLTISQSIPGSNVFHISVNDVALKTTHSGTYHGAVTVTEQHPDNSPSSSSQVSVSLDFSIGSFVASRSAVNFAPSLAQTVKLVSTPGPVSFTYSGSHTPPWLKVTFDQMTTPAVMTLVADPVGAPLQATTHTIALTPSTPGYPALTVAVTIQAANLTFKAAPFTALAATIDGNSVTFPSAVKWIVGSAHRVDVPNSFTPDGRTYYRFQTWPPTPQASPRLDLITQPGPLVYTAQYDTYYTLNVSPSPTAGGTVSLSPKPPPNNTYLAGSQVTITATPNPGLLFKQFTGALTSQQSPAVITMNAPSSVTAVFVPQQAQVTFNTSPPGLSILVDGASISTPVSFAWAPAEVHSVAGPTQPLSQGSQAAFMSWSDNGSTTSPRTFTGITKSATYTLNFATQYLVSVQISPSLSGTVTGAGWYTSGSIATLLETAAQGFTFSSYSGGITSTQKSVQFAVVGPVQVTANFTAAAAPVLFVSSSGRTENPDGTVTVPIVLNDLATAGPAGNAMITGVTVVGVPTGGGGPTVIGPAFPIPMGTIFPSKSNQTAITVNWPTSATRVTFNVQFSAIGGAYTGSTNISIFR